MNPYLRQAIDKSHEFLKANLYPENHVYRREIDEAFLMRKRPSKSRIRFVEEKFFNTHHSIPYSTLAIYESKFSIQEDISDKWLAEDVATMAKHLLKYPKLAYVNYYCNEVSYQHAIIHFDNVLKVDEYRSFWSDLNAGMKGSADSNMMQMKEQLKQEVKVELQDQLKQEIKAELKDQLKREVKQLKNQLKREDAELKEQLEEEVRAELKDQLKQEVKAELKDQLEQEVKQALMQSCGDNVRNTVNNATDKFFATFEGAKMQLRNDLRSIMMAEMKREFDRSSESQ